MPQKIEMTQDRAFKLDASIPQDRVDAEKREITFPFSSSYQADRGFYIEQVRQAGVNLDRIQDGGPLLLGHDPLKQIGCTLRSWVGDDGRLYTRVRFSKSKLGEEVFQDVMDGIRRNVSFRYRVKDYEELGSNDKGQPIVDVISSEALEVSFESVPADPTVGVGRSYETENKFKNRSNQGGASNMPIENGDVPRAGATGGDAVNMDRVLELMALGESHDKMELARSYIKNGGTADQMSAEILKSIQSVAHVNPGNTNDIPNADVGLTQTEARSFSISRAISGQMSGNWQGKEFERDVTRSASQVYNLVDLPDSFVMPTDVLRAGEDGITPKIDNSKVPTLTTAEGSGGGAVATEHRSFIDLLESKLVVKAAGAEVIRNLTSNLDIPNPTEGPIGSWTGENTKIKKSQIKVDKLSLSPKGCSTFVDISRLMMRQSTFALDAWLNRKLTTNLGLMFDRAIFDGSGPSRPSGIMSNVAVKNPKLGSGTSGGSLGYRSVVNLETLIASLDGDMGRMGYITSPVVRGFLKTAEKAENTAQFIWGSDNTLNGHAAFVTNNMPIGGTADKPQYSMICGDWSQVTIGEWGALYIQVDPYSQSEYDNIRIKGVIQVDAIINHPESFSYYNDIVV